MLDVTNSHQHHPLLYLLFGLLELLLQLCEPGFELVDPSQDTDPLFLQVAQLHTTAAACAGGVLVLQRETEG